MKLNGAQVILKMLELHGVKHVFGLPGETTIGWYKHWKADSNIEYILTRDERTASYAAEAYAKVTGRPCVLEAPSPGVTHCTPGITEAYLSSVPVIYFSSDIPLNHDKKHGLTGIDQTALYESICKESFVITNVSEIPFLLRRAFRVATSGRPAPVHIRVPSNIFHEEAEILDLYAQEEYQSYPAHRPVASLEKIKQTIDVLLASKKAVIVCGQGALISKASEVLVQIAHFLQIPIGTTTPAKGVIPENHPLSLRVIGARGGMQYSNEYVASCDTVFFVGTNTDSSSTDAWKLYGDVTSKTFIHLDIAEAHVGNNFPTQISLVGDAKASLEYMYELLKTQYSPVKKELKNINEIKQQALNEVFNKNIEMPKGTISPVKLSQALQEIMPNEAIITAEPGVSAIYPSSLLTFEKAGRRYLTNYSMGALGYAVPAALGASYAKENSPIIAFTGDGSLGFTIGDMETIKRSGKNVTIILTRNDTFGWIRGEAVLLEDVDEAFTTDFNAVDYIKVAQGFGFTCSQITNEDEIKSKLEEAILNEGANFIEIMVPSQDKIVPFVPSWVAAAKEKNIPYFY